MKRYEFLGGDTVKIYGTFKSFTGQLANPTQLKFKVFNSSYELIDTVEGEDINHEGTGEYSVIYELPNVTKPIEIIFEWYGVLNAQPSIDRVRALISFV